MGLFKSIFGSEKPNIEKYLEDTYALKYNPHLSRKDIKEAIAKCKLESRKEGTDKLPEKFGDIIVEQAKKKDEICLKIYSKAISGGANEGDIRQWWNLHDLERRMVLWEDTMSRFATFHIMIADQGLSEGEAISQMRKSWATYGNPYDESKTQGVNRPLPNELHNRVNQTVLRLDPNSVREALKEFSTMNAYLRSIL